MEGRMGVALPLRGFDVKVMQLRDGQRTQWGLVVTIMTGTTREPSTLSPVAMAAEDALAFGNALAKHAQEILALPPGTPK